MPPTDVYKKSVTKNDLLPGGINMLQFFISQSPGGNPNLLPPLPAYWSYQRDFALSKTVLVEDNWATAISIAISKMSSITWDITGKPRNKDKIQRMFHTANLGRGWVFFLSQHLRDYLTTDNGAFIEIVRETSALSSKITGFVHLDSRRCIRTGDPDIPIIYRDRNGAFHEMKWYQILALSDMPDPGETYNGVGLCAASRAYKTVRRLAAIENYLYEKVSGTKPHVIHLVSGITPTSLKDALTQHDQSAEENAQSGVSYGEALIVPFLDDDKPGGYSIQIAGLPDGFDIGKERQEARKVYANALGLDPQELEALTGQALGTGAQSQVLDDKEQGKGLAMWRTEFAYLINEYGLPDTVTFSFSESDDYRDKLAAAQVTTAIATAVKTMIEAGIIDPPKGLQYMVDKDELPREFMTGPDVTLTDTLSSDEKPLDDTGLTTQENGAVDLVSMLTGKSFKDLIEAGEFTQGQADKILQLLPSAVKRQWYKDYARAKAA